MTKRVLVALTALSVSIGLWGPITGEAYASEPPAMSASQEAGEAEILDWCRPHALPESKCTKCNRDLIPAFKATGDWCPEHGFPESVCPICNPVPSRTSWPATGAPSTPSPSPNAPSVTRSWRRRSRSPATGALSTVFPESVCPICNPATPPPGFVADWCVEHALPESKCTKCNPELIDAFKVTGDWCPEHGFPESVCPLCNPATPPPGVSSIAPGTRIRFRSGEIERASGIEVTAASRVPLDEGVACTARLDFDRNAIADIRAPVPGIVREVRVDLGEAVEVGSPLFVLESGSVGELQARLASARQRVEVARAELGRQEELRASRISSARQLDVARQELDSAQADLEALESSLRIAGAPDAGPLGPLRAPLPDRRDPHPTPRHRRHLRHRRRLSRHRRRHQYHVGSPRRSLARCESRRRRSDRDHRGRGAGRPLLRGRITWLSAEVDPRTRTIAARAEVDNDGTLRANQFAQATIQIAAAEEALTVPSDAVQRLGKEQVVFVRTARDLRAPARHHRAPPSRPGADHRQARRRRLGGSRPERSS